MQENTGFLRGPKNKFLRKISAEKAGIYRILRIPVFICIFVQKKSCQKRKIQPCIELVLGSM
jgi:hypothetical protein